MKTIFSIREVNTFDLKGFPAHLKNHEYGTEQKATEAAEKLRAQLKEEYSTAQAGFRTPPIGYQVAPINVKDCYSPNDRYRN